MLDRTLFFALAAFAGVTGAFLLVAPATFHALVPGVMESGPYDAHLLRDVGLAHTMLATGMVLAFVQPANAPAVSAMAASIEEPSPRQTVVQESREKPRTK